MSTTTAPASGTAEQPLEEWLVRPGTVLGDVEQLLRGRGPLSADRIAARLHRRRSHVLRALEQHPLVSRNGHRRGRACRWSLAKCGSDLRPLQPTQSELVITTHVITTPVLDPPAKERGRHGRPRRSDPLSPVEGREHVERPRLILAGDAPPGSIVQLRDGWFGVILKPDRGVGVPVDTWDIPSCRVDPEEEVLLIDGPALRKRPASSHSGSAARANGARVEPLPASAPGG